MDFERALKAVEDYLALIRKYELHGEIEFTTPTGLPSNRDAKAAKEVAEAELQTRLPLIVGIGGSSMAILRAA